MMHPKTPDDKEGVFPQHSELASLLTYVVPTKSREERERPVQYLLTVGVLRIYYK